MSVCLFRFLHFHMHPLLMFIYPTTLPWSWLAEWCVYSFIKRSVTTWQTNLVKCKCNALYAALIMLVCGRMYVYMRMIVSWTLAIMVSTKNEGCLKRAEMYAILRQILTPNHLHTYIHTYWNRWDSSESGWIYLTTYMQSHQQISVEEIWSIYCKMCKHRYSDIETY